MFLLGRNGFGVTSGTIKKQHIKTLIKILTQNTQRRNIKYDATPDPKWPKIQFQIHI